MKTSELNDIALDWAVATIEEPSSMKYGVADWVEQRRRNSRHGEFLYRYHQSWAQAGPIIEREKLILGYIGEIWECRYFEGIKFKSCEYGPTPLIAAMRCFVASKLGNEVEIPEGLL